MSDLIRRIDAVQACQVGPSDEWSRSTKDGYNQAATDCAMNILRIPAVHMATNAELEALRKAAGIPHLPTQLTFEARLAIGGEGPRAYDWSDKPHRIVYDLCREIEKNAACIEQLEKELSICRMAQIVMDNTVETLTAERDAARTVLKEIPSATPNA